MSERPDIGRMIDEELAGMGAEEELPGSRPIADGELHDLRTPAERMADRRRAEEAPTEHGESAPEAPVPDPEAKEAKTALERERKQLETEFGALHERIAAGAGAEETEKKALDAQKSELIRKMIELASRSDSKLSTNILKEGVAVADEKTTHIFGAGLRSVTEKILDAQDFRGQLNTLLERQPDAEVAIKALMKNLDRRVEKIAKATEQKIRLYEGVKPAEGGRPDAAASGNARAKGSEQGRAMKPFFDDVRKMMRAPSRKPEARQKPQEKKKRGFWDRLFGKKAA